MSKLAEVLYPTPPVPNTAGSLLHWWESRRLLYNKVVGAAGLVTLTTVSLLSTFVLGEGPPPLGFAVGVSLAWGVMANVCYSLGFFTELAARLLWKEKAPPMGPLLFREGLIFSVGLTLFPIAVISMGVAAQVIVRVFAYIF